MHGEGVRTMTGRTQCLGKALEAMLVRSSAMRVNKLTCLRDSHENAQACHIETITDSPRGEPLSTHLRGLRSCVRIRGTSRYVLGYRVGGCDKNGAPWPDPTQTRSLRTTVTDGAGAAQGYSLAVSIPSMCSISTVSEIENIDVADLEQRVRKKEHSQSNEVLLIRNVYVGL
jgi:hypothetical protein